MIKKKMSRNTQHLQIDLKRSQNDSFCDQNVGSPKNTNLTLNPWRELRQRYTNIGKKIDQTVP